MKFEFDPVKSATNKDKHGIDFVQAQMLWADEEVEVVLSKSRATDEARFLAIGRIEGRHWTAICTVRGEAIRIISVRRARKEEVDYYEGN